MPIYVDQRRYTGKGSININSFSENCDQINQIESNSVQNNSFLDHSFKRSRIQESFLSSRESSTANSSVPSSSGQDSDLKIFLDMDGVLTDFTGACEKLSEYMMLWYTADRELF